jgi:lipoprotein-anchoring transpeptidase ErfK/SrfK
LRLPKIIFYGAIAIFGLIGILYFVKGKQPSSSVVQEIACSEESVKTNEEPKVDLKKSANVNEENASSTIIPAAVQEESDQVNLVDKLFTTDEHLPIVDTVTYSSRVPWLKGRAAWIADYASHFQTSRHFIARSLNKKPDYFTQKVLSGDRFNVIKKDVTFHLIVDLSKTKLWFYALDKATNSRYLLKTYTVGVGRKDPSKSSGCLTPVGKYWLGSKIAIYKPGTMGYFQDRKIEMLQVFGTRWIPFEKPADNTSANVKGYGLHGAPWATNAKTQELQEDLEKLGKYDSDGCIRLASKDIEEIFSIVITKPTMVEIVKEYNDASLQTNQKE